jgi:twitching motility two-component system response regulator PilH
MASVLVIDDQKAIRTVLAMVLEELGHEVELAENGEQGIELLKGSSNFDLVITDIKMPNKDGNEVVRHIRTSQRSSTPVVAITGFPDDVDTELFDYTIIKPFKLEKLRTIVDRFTNFDLSKDDRFRRTHKNTL